jgi:hypothetical protein
MDNKSPNTPHNLPNYYYSCDDFIKVDTEVFDRKIITVHLEPLRRFFSLDGNFAYWLQCTLRARSIVRNDVCEVINSLLQFLNTANINVNIAGVVGIYLFDGSYGKADITDLNSCYANAVVLLDTYNESKSPEDKKRLHDAVEDATSAVMGKTLVKLHEEIQDKWREAKASSRGFFNR